MPGILMGLLQIGWFAVAHVRGDGLHPEGRRHRLPDPGTLPFIIVGLIWGLSLVVRRAPRAFSTSRRSRRS